MGTSRVLLFIAVSLVRPADCSGSCGTNNYRSVENAPDDALIYGITQDCQMFFIRPSQLHLLSSIRIDRRHSFCYANLVQLHVKSHDTLLLTFKQASNRICTLEVHIPALNMLFGDHLFRYSLLNSLPYASCSHSKDQSFQLEPDLSFMDPVYNDVLYFIDALSSGKQWKIHQFLLKETGNMNMMNNLTISIQTKDLSSNEFVVSLDNQRDKLYRRNRFDNLIYQQCAFEMLFRQKDSQISSFETPSRGYGAILNGQSVDGDMMVYAETDKTTDPPTTRLNMLSTVHPDHVACIASTTFSFDVGIIRESTVQKLKTEPRPPFGTKVSPRPSSKSEKLNEQVNQKIKNTTPSSNSKPSKPESPRTLSTASITPTSPTSWKTKGAYSPSKLFFSYEMNERETTTTTSSASSEKMLKSNAIPVEEISKEQEEEEVEELNEIIKELKSDEDDEHGENEKEVGELKTREVNMISENKENTSDGTHANDTSSDAEAVKSSRSGINSNYISMYSSVILFVKYFA